MVYLYIALGLLSLVVCYDLLQKIVIDSGSGLVYQTQQLINIRPAVFVQLQPNGFRLMVLARTSFRMHMTRVLDMLLLCSLPIWR